MSPRSERRGFLVSLLSLGTVVLLSPVVARATYRLDELSPDQQEMIRERWRRFRALPRATQLRIRNAYVLLLKKTPEEQFYLREWANRWKDLPQEKREKISENLRRYWRLDPERKQMLREQWELQPRG